MQTKSSSPENAMDPNDNARHPPIPERPNLRNQVLALWRERFLIGTITAVFTICALTAALVLPNKYVATTLLFPVSSNSELGAFGALGSLGGAFGSMAELAGLTGQTSSKRSEEIAILKSRALTMQFIKEKNLMPILYASKWNKRLNRWRSQNPNYVPTAWKAFRKFNKKIRKVIVSEKSGLVTLEITWHDPTQAAEWANGLVELANSYLRSRAISKAEQNISYLESEAEQTNVVEERRAIYSVMSIEINKAMLARGNIEYAFRVLDPAVAPEMPSSPKPILWTILGFLGGLFTGIFIAFVRTAWNEASDTI